MESVSPLKIGVVESSAVDVNTFRYDFSLSLSFFWINFFFFKITYTLFSMGRPTSRPRDHDWPY